MNLIRKLSLRCFSSIGAKFDARVDYYKILRVGEKTPMNEIKQQYYKLAKMYHPDVNASNEALFKQISEAYRILSQHKEEYDQARKLGNGYGNAYSYQQQQQEQTYSAQRDKKYYERMKERAFEDKRAFEEEQLRKKEFYLKQKQAEEQRFQEYLKQRQAQYQQKVQAESGYQQYEQLKNQKSSNYTFGQDWRVYEQQAFEYVKERMSQKEVKKTEQQKEDPRMPKQRNIFEEYARRSK